MIPGITILGVKKASAFVLIDRTTGTNIGTLTSQGGLAAAFDGVTSQVNESCAFLSTAGYVGKTLTGPKVFGQAISHGSNTHGYAVIGNPNLTLNIRGKVGSAPSSRTDGTIVGTITFTDTSNESAGRTINSTDLTTLWDHIFLEATVDTGAGNSVAEVILYEWA